MPKVIERPMSTTYLFEMPFHLIRSREEARNIKAVVAGRKIVQVSRSVDMGSFQPILYFAIEEADKPMDRWLKYVTPMELWIDEEPI